MSIKTGLNISLALTLLVVCIGTLITAKSQNYIAKFLILIISLVFSIFGNNILDDSLIRNYDEGMSNNPTPVIPARISDEEWAFIHAVSFERVAIQIHTQYGLDKPQTANIKDDNPTQMTIPYAVNSSFAIEIFLKCLARLEGAPQRGHDLAKLYEALKLDHKIRIKEKYKGVLEYSKVSKDAKYGPNQLDLYDLDAVLEEQKDSFRDHRYIFEGTAGIITYSLYPFLYAVKETILELKPDWSKHSAHYKQPT